MEWLAGSDCEVEEFQLSLDREQLAHLSGHSLAELQLGRRSGALVLAIRTPPSLVGAPGAAVESELIANPGGSERLAPGQLLVVLGSKQQLNRFAELLGPGLASVEVMSS